MAIPPYVAWLAELSLVWGPEKVKDFARKVVALSGGRLRYSEEERVVSGEFPIMANIGDALGAMWTWQAKGAPLVAVPGLNPINTDYFQLGVPKNAAHPNLAKLFVAFMASKDAQAVLQKYESRSSHLVEGTVMAKYLRDNRVAGPRAERIDIVLPQRRIGGRSTVQGRFGEDIETMTNDNGILE